MTRSLNYFAALCCAAGLVACGGDGGQGGAADTTARNLTLAPAETTAQRADVPAQAKAPAPAPRSAPAAARPSTAPTRPAAPAMVSLAAGASFGLTMNDSITTRTAKAGETFTATVASDVRDANGRLVIPQGATVTGSIVEVAPAPNPSEAGTMVLAVKEISVRGRTYTLDATIDSVATQRRGRGIEGADAAKVGAGAAAGAIAGRIIGKNTKGAVIGGVVGAAVGAGVAAGTKDVDIVVPAGARLVISLTRPLQVRAS